MRPGAPIGALLLAAACQRPPERVVCAAEPQLPPAACRLERGPEVEPATGVMPWTWMKGGRVGAVDGARLRVLDPWAGSAAEAVVASVTLAHDARGKRAQAARPDVAAVVERDASGALALELLGADATPLGEPQIWGGELASAASVVLSPTAQGFALWAGDVRGRTAMLALDEGGAVIGGPLAFEPGEAVSVDAVAGGPDEAAIAYRQVLDAATSRVLFAPLAGQGTRADILAIGEPGPYESAQLAALGQGGYALVARTPERSRLWWLERGQAPCASEDDAPSGVVFAGALGRRLVLLADAAGAPRALVRDDGAWQELPLPGLGEAAVVGDALVIVPRGASGPLLRVTCADPAAAHPG